MKVLSKTKIIEKARESGVKPELPKTEAPKVKGYKIIVTILNNDEYTIDKGYLPYPDESAKVIGTEGFQFEDKYFPCHMIKKVQWIKYEI
jgi:hypothetical protein